MYFILETINSKSKLYEFIFFTVLFFLIVVVYFGGLINTLYFFFHLERNPIYLILPKIIFFFLVVVQLCFPQFGKNMLFLFLDPVLIEKFKRRLNNYNEFVNNHPFLTFFLFHSLLCLTLLHYFMIYFTGTDIGIEIFYYFFNFGKILLMPAIIFSFVLLKYPRYLVAGGGTAELGDTAYTVTKKVIADAAELAPKYPRTAAAVALAAGTVATAAAIGSQEQQRIAQSRQRGDPATIDPALLARSRSLEENQDAMLDIEHRASGSVIITGLRSVKRRLSGEDSFNGEYHKRQTDARHLQTQTIAEMEREKQLSEKQWHQKVEESKQSGEIPSLAGTEKVVDYQSGQDSAQSPTVPSSLESFFDFF
jgi:hypothetical protein